MLPAPTLKTKSVSWEDCICGWQWKGDSCSEWRMMDPHSEGSQAGIPQAMGGDKTL
ncbi:unnamed protein product [Staurois parvus]|uniref:Uncharacterized protein n=1 Tax=Staurois parvus TaxID=386267 RepID=A0ABN9DLP2_9NEOB|nr:unnamed protein product [Staurois parvus]